MNEVTKLYENAEVKKKQNCSHGTTHYQNIQTIPQIVRQFALIEYNLSDTMALS